MRTTHRPRTAHCLALLAALAAIASGHALAQRAPPTAPNVSLSSTTMDFNNVDVGATSPEKRVSLLSSGSAPYRINSIDSNPSCTGAPMCAAGDFLCATDCKLSTDYAPGKSCDIAGKFSPKSPGFAATTIYICDNTAASPQSITLTGTGVTPPPVEISPSSYDYGRILVGGRSEGTFTIINHATIEATLGPVTVNAADFAVTSTNCGATLAPVSACYASVAFMPTQPGTSTALLEVPVAFPLTASLSKVLTDGPPPASAKANLQGTGYQSAELVLPTSIDFGSFTLGSTSPLVKSLKLTNTGNAVLTFAGMAVTGPFALINECPLNLGPGESCFLRLEFRTTTVGDFAGVLNIVTNATDGSRAIALVAKSQLTPRPVIRVRPESIGFGSQMIGSISAAQKITVKNEGGAVAALGALTLSPDFVVIGTTCGLALEPGLTCFADVAMRPLGFGQRSGQLLVPSNAEGNPHVVNMVGTGCRPFSFGSNRGGGGLGCAP